MIHDMGEDDGDDGLGAFNKAMGANQIRSGKPPAEVIPIHRNAPPAVPGGGGSEPTAVPVDDGECPVGFLGQRGDEFFFFDHHGQIRRLTAQKIARGAEIDALFGSRGMAWLAGQMPARDKDGKIVAGHYSVGLVHVWILEQTERAGLFDPAMPVRGIGVWRAGDLPVLHLGNTLLWGAAWRRPGFRAEGALWPAYHGAAAKASPAPPEDVQKLELMVRRWNWREPFSPEMMIGLWAAGLMGAAIPWRPHGFLLGEAGAGKSTLVKLLEAANPLAKAVEDYTEAGLRQVLSTHASAILLDEADPDDAMAAEKLQRVIGLLRRASDGVGARVLRGGAGGDSQTFTVVGSAIMGGTLPPTLNAADASRITLLAIKAQPKDARAPKEVEIAGFRRLGPCFLARAVGVLDRFPAAFAAAREQILAMDGGAQRVADQIGAILAARHIMISDAEFPIMGDELSDLDWAIPSAEDREVDSSSRQCWHHLLDSSLESYRSGERPTVRRVLADALGPPDAVSSRAQSDLFEHGMRVGHYPLSARDGPICLYVRNSHPRLNAIFAGTRWAGNKWGEELSRLPDAQRPRLAVSLRKGDKHRCVVIPPSLLPGRWDEWDTS